MRSRALSNSTRIALLAVLYFAVAKLCLLMDAVSGFAALVWPPTGISLAALLLFGNRVWPGVFLGAFAVNWHTGAPIGTACGIAAGNSIEALLGAYLLRRVGFRRSMGRVVDALALCALAALCSTAASASIGVLSLWAGGVVRASSLAATWTAWWVGDMLGDLVVAPMLLVWSVRPRPHLERRRILEACGLAAGLLLTGIVVFGVPLRTPLPLSYLVFPPLIWAALRFGSRGAATATFALAALAVWGTASGLGPFASGRLSQSLLSLQLFMGVVAVTTMILSGVVTERESADRALKQLNEKLEERVERRTRQVEAANADLRAEIEERRRTEEALRHREMQLAIAQEIGGVGSWEWDVARNHVTWSDELYRLYGMRPQECEIDFEGFLQRVHPDDRQLIRDTVQTCFTSHEPFEFEHRIVWPNGEVRWVYGRGRAVAGAQGDIVAMNGTSLDITERKQVEEEIQRLNEGLEQKVEERTAELQDTIRELEAFSYSVSHDLRSPLRSVNGYAGMLLEDYASKLDAEGQRYLWNIRASTENMGQLIDNLLTFSRLGRQDLQPLESIDMVALVRETFDELAQDQQDRDIRLEIRDLPPLRGNPAMIRQVLSNLLSNAMKFSRTRTTAIIEVGCRQETDRDVYYVSDNGVGFDMRHASNLFGVFQRLHGVEEFEGNGVGLALVQRIVQRHGGEVWAEARPNAGASFYFAFSSAGRAPEAAETGGAAR